MRPLFILAMFISIGYGSENIIDWVNFDRVPEDQKAGLKDAITSLVKDNSVNGISEIRYGANIMWDTGDLATIDIVQFTYDPSYVTDRTFDNNGKTAKELRQVTIIFSQKITLLDAVTTTCASLIHK